MKKGQIVEGFDLDYDIKICDSPNDVKDIIFEKNKIKVRNTLTVDKNGD